MKDILARAKKAAQEAELFILTSEETQVQFEANRLKRIQSKQNRTTALRVIKDGRIGLALAAGAVDPARLVDAAVETAEFGMQARFEFPARINYPRVEICDPGAATIDPDMMTKLGQDLIGAIISHTPGILCEAGVTSAEISVQISNTRGANTSYSKSVFSLGVEGTLIRGTDMLFVGDGESSCRPFADSRRVAENVLVQLERARDIAAAPSREIPVIFTPHGVASALVPALMAGFNGKTVLEGASPVGSKLGETIFYPGFSLYDDPTVPNRPHSRPCDDEGVPSQRTALIRKGKVSGFLYDLQTAARAGRRSTGNASRGRDGLPGPGPSGFIIEAGTASFDEMLGDIKEGIVVEQLLGAEQGNILGGDFSGNVLLGYLVKNGKLVGRVKNTMVTGNVYQVLKDIAAVGKETRWVDGFLQTPPIYCPRLSVTSK